MKKLHITWASCGYSSVVSAFVAMLLGCFASMHQSPLDVACALGITLCVFHLGQMITRRISQALLDHGIEKKVVKEMVLYVCFLTTLSYIILDIAFHIIDIVPNLMAASLVSAVLLLIAYTCAITIEKN